MADDYAGDLTPREAWAALQQDPQAVLVDVRTQAEWNYIGVPDLSPIGKTLVKVEWQSYPTGLNPDFAAQIAAAGVGKDQKVLLLCRSGVRSKAAAQLLTSRGWQTCHNVSDGFEGPHDARKHRGNVAGWQFDDLPWTQG